MQALQPWPRCSCCWPRLLTFVALLRGLRLQCGYLPGSVSLASKAILGTESRILQLLIRGSWQAITSNELSSLTDLGFSTEAPSLTVHRAAMFRLACSSSSLSSARTLLEQAHDGPAAPLGRWILVCSSFLPIATQSLLCSLTSLLLLFVPFRLVHEVFYVCVALVACTLRLLGVSAVGWEILLTTMPCRGSGTSRLQAPRCHSDSTCHLERRQHLSPISVCGQLLSPARHHRGRPH